MHDDAYIGGCSENIINASCMTISGERSMSYNCNKKRSWCWQTRATRCKTGFGLVDSLVSLHLFAITEKLTARRILGSESDVTSPTTAARFNCSVFNILPWEPQYSFMNEWTNETDGDHNTTAYWCDVIQYWASLRYRLVLCYNGIWNFCNVQPFCIPVIWYYSCTFTHECC